MLLSQHHVRSKRFRMQLILGTTEIAPVKIWHVSVDLYDGIDTSYAALSCNQSSSSPICRCLMVWPPCHVF